MFIFGDVLHDTKKTQLNSQESAVQNGNPLYVVLN